MILLLFSMLILTLNVSFAHSITSDTSNLPNTDGQVSSVISEQFPNMEFIYLDYKIGGDVTRNSEIVANIPKTELSSKIFEMEKQGSVVVKLGNGGAPVLLICAGIHGNEEEANIAAMKYLEFVQNQNFNGTLYVIPFALPKTTAVNSRYYNGQDPNRIANYPGTPGYNIVQFAIQNGVQYILDLHSGSDVGSKGLIYYTTSYYPAEINWVNFVKLKTGCNVISGIGEPGMIRIVAHKAGINTITVEVERDSIATSTAAATEYKLLLAACQFLGFPTPQGTTTSELKIISTNPIQNAVNVALNKTITVTFNTPIFPGTSYGDISLKTASNTAVPVTVTINGSILSIKPQTLSLNTTYLLNIPYNAVKDVNGKNLLKSYTLKFTTQTSQYPRRH